MKYIKEYKEIDWDNDVFDIEEEDPTTHNEFIGHELFYKFLKDNDILDDFIKNFDPQFDSKVTQYDPNSIKEYLDYNYDYNYIDKAFDWSDSIINDNGDDFDKFDFWDDHSESWNDIIKNK